MPVDDPRITVREGAGLSSKPQKMASDLHRNQVPLGSAPRRIGTFLAVPDQGAKPVLTRANTNHRDQGDDPCPQNLWAKCGHGVINPGNFSQVYLGFDVPKGTTPSQYVLLLHASADSAGVTIRLPDTYNAWLSSPPTTTSR